MKMITCTKCGESKDISCFHIDNNHKKGVKSRCKICAHNDYCENKEILKQRNRKWRLDNYEKVALIHQEYRKKNKDYCRTLSRNAKLRKTESLTDYYIKQQMRKKGYTSDQLQLNPELINIQRIIIQIKRQCKTSKN